MSLDIKREMIGDILVGNGRTVVFILNAILPMVAEMSKVGRFGVSISYDFSPDDIPAAAFDVINATVQSLRLDSVLSSAINHSREKTQKLIKSNGVVLNHVMTYEPSEKMSEGDIFSVRGIGKFVLSGVGGLSKKDRIFITINKYK